MRPALDEDAVTQAGRIARGLFPDDVAVAALDPRLDHAGLMREEEPAIVAAIDRRRREYTAGRVAARRAMASLGLHGRPVQSGEDRAPIWPEGVVGSLSHTKTCCLAAVALARDYRAVGVDLEIDAPLAPALRDTVCGPEERAWLGARPHAERGGLATLIFSAKECAYKCQYPLTRTLCGFDAMRIEPNLAAATFHAVLTRTLGAFDVGARLPGRFSTGAGLILTAMTLPR